MSDHGPLPQTLGRYRVIRRLGAGGMAEVFLARQTGAEGIEKVLVVKRVLPTFARSAKFRTMFIDEAKVALRLNHPNIVQVYAFEQVREEFLLAMELVDGLDLGRLVAAAKRLDRRIPYGLAAFIIAELAKGLDYAHNRKDEQGQPLEIVHRDVSPQNLLLSYEGGVKVADFGIARARMVSEETGVIKGKFAYMSPEQARGAKVDRRSDVYSIGVLLGELLMARAMYPGQVGLDVLDLVRVGKRTLPREVDPEVPEVLNRIVRDATALDVEERPQTARALASALSTFLHAEEDVWDGAALEQFIAEVAPRETTSPDGRALRGEAGRLMGFRYESYDAADIDRWLDTYLTMRPYWAPLDHAKPGLENARTARSLMLAPRADGSMDASAHAQLGAPASISWAFRGLDANRLEIAVTLHDKPANRMPEASFISFTPAGAHAWEFLKTGTWLRADKVAPRGGGQLQAVSAARSEGLSLTPLDTPLVAPARTDFMAFDGLPPDYGAGLRFNLHNNKWGTNFRMWWGAERFTARFVLEFT